MRKRSILKRGRPALSQLASASDECQHSIHAVAEAAIMIAKKQIPMKMLAFQQISGEGFIMVLYRGNGNAYAA